MLTRLDIRGLAIIESLSIEFASSLNVITGETGAGKSILIKALGLVSGAKASSEVVRKGFDCATVVACFQVDASHPVMGDYLELGLPIEKHAKQVELIVRRQIHSKGRSQAWVNDVPISLHALRKLSSSLIDIFAQHETYRFLDANLHLYYLDKFIEEPGVISTYERAYQSLQADISRVKQLVERFSSKFKERDYLEFRRQEIERLAPSKLDYNQLESYVSSAQEGLQRSKVLLQLQELVDNGFSGRPLSNALSEVKKSLDKLQRSSPTEKQISSLIEMASQAGSLIDELSYELGRLLATTEVDDSGFEKAQDRLGAYKDLIRKLGVADAEALELESQRISEELAFVEQGEDELRVLLSSIEKGVSQVLDLASRLTRIRDAAFKHIKRRVEDELAELNMKGARLELEFSLINQNHSDILFPEVLQDLQQRWKILELEIARLGRSGTHKPQFLLAANPGEPAKSLAKVASGGELSRIMLGIKKVLSLGAQSCVMVFDEIDTGISGQTASIVGLKLAELAKDFQVLCISHLPQVAAYAQSHFRVEKIVSQGRTESNIVKLDSLESQTEVARLLSGDEITGPSLQNAKLLIEKAKHDKNSDKAPLRGKKSSRFKKKSSGLSAETF